MLSNLGTMDAGHAVCICPHHNTNIIFDHHCGERGLPLPLEEPPARNLEHSQPTSLAQGTRPMGAKEAREPLPGALLLALKSLLAPYQPQAEPGQGSRSPMSAKSE